REEQLKELTASEKDLFQYLEDGYKINQIANIMFKAQNTLKQQVRSILKKLNVRSSKAAVKKVKFGGLYEEKNPPN
ncbi:MAG TPA: helix-turn-helix transcriptional regulator, partial [Clostridia bacterium]